MQTAGLTMNTVWADRVLRERGVSTIRMDGIEADIGVMVETAELLHRSAEENFAPYVHLSGELRWIRPLEELPYGIDEVSYEVGTGERVDAYYEFDQEQMAALVTKGYFVRGFDVPGQITGVEWELPADVDVMVLEPSPEVQGDVPVVFTQVHDSADLVIDVESSGYDIVQYFDDHSGAGVEAEQVSENVLRSRSDALNPLFSEEELDLDSHREQHARAVPEQKTAQPAAGVDAHLYELAAEIEAERERLAGERASLLGSTENLYRERVAPVLQDAPASSASDEALIEPEDLLFTDAEDELVDNAAVLEEVAQAKKRQQQVSHQSPPASPSTPSRPTDLSFDDDEEEAQEEAEPGLG